MDSAPDCCTACLSNVQGGLGPLAIVIQCLNMSASTVGMEMAEEKGTDSSRFDLHLAKDCLQYLCSHSGGVGHPPLPTLPRASTGTVGRAGLCSLVSILNWPMQFDLFYPAAIYHEELLLCEGECV